MLFSNFLILSAVTVTIESRSIGQYMPDLKIPTINSKLVMSKASEPNCLFTPSHSMTHLSAEAQKPVSASSSSTIPASAWPHITSLLSSHLSPFISATNKYSHTITLRLSDSIDNVAVEGIVLGLVFTAPEVTAAEKDLRSIGRTTRRNDEGVIHAVDDRIPGGSRTGDIVIKVTDEKDESTECLMSAIKVAGNEKTMEGSLGFGDKGRVGFLVYRDD